MTPTERCRRSVVRADRAIGFAIVNSTTPPIGNRLAHIKKKIDELLELLHVDIEGEIENERTSGES